MKRREWNPDSPGAIRLREILADQKRERNKDEQRKRILLGWWQAVVAACSPSFINSLNGGFEFEEEADADLSRIIRENRNVIEELIEENYLLIEADLRPEAALARERIVAGYDS